MSTQLDTVHPGDEDWETRAEQWITVATINHKAIKTESDRLVPTRLTPALRPDISAFRIG